MTTTDDSPGTGSGSSSYRPSRVIALGMVCVVLVSLGLFGFVELMRGGTFDSERLCDAVRTAASALLVGGVLSLIFEIVIQRQASKAADQALRATFAPVTEGLRQQQAILEAMLRTADRTMDLSHVMGVSPTYVTLLWS